MARSRTSGDDHEFGYKKPPKHTRWVKGQSGNPKGRGKKSPQPSPPDGLSEENARTLRLLDEEVSVNVEGHARRMTRGEAVDRALLRQAVAGDIRAIKLLDERRARALAEKAALEAALGREESAALTALLARRLRSQRQAEFDREATQATGAVGDASPDAPDDAGSDASDDAGWGEDLEGPGGADVAGDRFAGSIAEWRDLAPHTSEPSPPEQPSAGAGGPPPREAVGGMHWGNATPHPQPPRVRPARRPSSSEPLIRSTRPLTRGY